MIKQVWLLTTFALCCLYRRHQFVWCSESSPEEASLSPSLEPPCFDRWGNHWWCCLKTIKWEHSFSFLTFVSFFSVASSAASYAVTRWETQKCSDLWLLLETGKVPDRSPPKGQYNVWLQTVCCRQCLTCALVPCFVFQRPRQKYLKARQRQNMEMLWNEHWLL